MAAHATLCALLPRERTNDLIQQSNDNLKTFHRKPKSKEKWGRKGL